MFISKREDFIFIILVYAGFAPRTICMFTNIKFKHFYNKRSRLIERIKKSDVKDKRMVCFKISKIIIHLIVFYIANLLKYRDITSEEF